MLKTVPKKQLIFDIETVPDVETARRTFPELDAVAEAAELGVIQNPNEVILRQMYQNHGATADNPRPMLRYRFHKVVSISAIELTMRGSQYGWHETVELKFHVFRGDEKDLIQRFLDFVGSEKFALVGWCSQGFDIPMLVQRALIKKVSAPKFFERPDKPWEGVDYFAKGSDWNIDLYQIIKGTSFSSDASSSLSDFCRAIGVPGKIGVDGADVADMWAAGREEELLQYNMSDVISTLLVWYHVLFTAGKIVEDELVRVKRDMYGRIAAKEQDHWKRYAAEWYDRDPDIRENDHERTDTRRDGVSGETSNAESEVGPTDSAD